MATIRRWAAALCSGMLLFAGCEGQGPKLYRYEATFLTLFDTVTTVVGYRESREVFAAEVQMLYEQLEEYHQLYDIYHDYPGVVNLKTVNDRAGGDPVKVDRRIIGLLLKAKQLYGVTKGKVNVAYGSVLSIWHDYREQGIADPESAALPPGQLLAEAGCHTDIGRLEIDEEAATVRLADPGMRLDVGAIAKGYAVEQVCIQAEKNGIGSLLVSVGGNIRAIGRMENGEEQGPWRVSVPNPEEGRQNEALCTVGVQDASLVSSGGYQRYYTVDGVRYHHIIDPDTQMPAQRFAAVTVAAPDAGLADALSTALFTLPCGEGLALVEAMDRVGAMWVWEDGSSRQSPYFTELVQEP